MLLNIDRKESHAEEARQAPASLLASVSDDFMAKDQATPLSKTNKTDSLSYQKSMPARTRKDLQKKLRCENTFRQLDITDLSDACSDSGSETSDAAFSDY